MLKQAKMFDCEHLKVLNLIKKICKREEISVTEMHISPIKFQHFDIHFFAYLARPFFASLF
jgi:hypothetical protein